MGMIGDIYDNGADDVVICCGELLVMPDGSSVGVNTVSFPIRKLEIETLDYEIDASCEYVLCVVRFEESSNALQDLSLEVWEDDGYDAARELDTSLLEKEEKRTIIDYAAECLSAYVEKS